MTPEQREEARLRREEEEARRRSEAEGDDRPAGPDLADPPEQRALLRPVFDANRYIYNRGAELANAQKRAGGKVTATWLRREVRRTCTNDPVWHGGGRRCRRARLGRVGAGSSTSCGGRRSVRPGQGRQEHERALRARGRREGRRREGEGSGRSSSARGRTGPSRCRCSRRT